MISQSRLITITVHVGFGSRFRDTYDHNSISGNSRKTCPFYEELSDLYGYKANVRPVALASSSKRPAPEAAASASGQSSSEESEEAQEERREERRKRPKKHQTTQAERIMETMVEMHKNQLESIKEMHNAKMNLLKEFIEVIKNKN